MSDAKHSLGSGEHARIFSLGHSTRSLDDLLALLETRGVHILADVRTIPRSRRHPHFARETLAQALEQARVRYVHLPELGGLRRPRPDSPNDAWENASFRGYADHMTSPAFAEGLARLLGLTQHGPVAVMCAEALPWRCHRSLIADALLARGVRVEHILGSSQTRPHAMTAFANVEGETITYPAPLRP